MPLNLAYHSSGLVDSQRVWLMISSDAYRADTVSALDKLSIWKGADKNRRSEAWADDAPRPRYQEISWEIPSESLDEARAIIETHQETSLMTGEAFFDLLQQDDALNEINSSLR